MDEKLMRYKPELMNLLEVASACLIKSCLKKKKQQQQKNIYPALPGGLKSLLPFLIPVGVRAYSTTESIIALILLHQLTVVPKHVARLKWAFRK